VLPYRALCEQKAAHFRRVLRGRWDVAELFGSRGRLELDSTAGALCSGAVLLIDSVC
jgi:hypothetical protein